MVLAIVRIYGYLLDMDTTDDSYWQRVAAGVRAELARQRRNALDLVPVIGLNRNAVYSRVNGNTPFKLNEIDAVAQFLGVSLADLAEPRREVGV